MGSRESTAILFFASLFLAAPETPAGESRPANYRHSVFQLETTELPHIASKIRQEIQRNDHTARLYWHADRKKLFIIHHGSLSIQQLQALLNDLDIPVAAVHPGKAGTGGKIPHPERPLRYIGGRKICGATKTAWRNLLRKYFFPTDHS